MIKKFSKLFLITLLFLFISTPTFSKETDDTGDGSGGRSDSRYIEDPKDGGDLAGGRRGRRSDQLSEMEDVDPSMGSKSKRKATEEGMAGETSIFGSPSTLPAPRNFNGGDDPGGRPDSGDRSGGR